MNDSPDYTVANSSVEDFLWGIESKVKRHRKRREKVDKKASPENEDIGTEGRTEEAGGKSGDDDEEWVDDIESEEEPTTQKSRFSGKEKERQMKGNLVS